MQSEPYDIQRELDNEIVRCLSCDGAGYHDRYYSEFDIEEVPCEACNGKGQLRWSEIPENDLDRYEKMLPSVPATPTEKLCAKCRGMGFIHIGKIPYLYTVSCDKCDGWGVDRTRAA